MVDTCGGASWPEDVIDLRSDTATRPCASMRELLRDASVGDASIGEDPSVRDLEARTAALLGHEDAVFVPTNTMANQLGLRVLVDPGEEFLAETESHILVSEGAAGALAGLQSRTVRGSSGRMDVAEVVSTLGREPYGVRTAAVTVELTHNRAGGTVTPLPELRQMHAETSSLGVAMHCDGARIWNAHVASGTRLHDYGALFASLSVCFSKGLGAPVGSVLVTSSEHAARARRFRKQMGGGMRQAGILAQAACHALERHLSDLADDHRRAGLVADAIRATGVGSIRGAAETNIVLWDMAGSQVSAAAVVEGAALHGIKLGRFGPELVRLVLHRDIDDEQVARFTDVLNDIVTAPQSSRDHRLKESGA